MKGGGSVLMGRRLKENSWSRRWEWFVGSIDFFEFFARQVNSHAGGDRKAVPKHSLAHLSFFLPSPRHILGIPPPLPGLGNNPKVSDNAGTAGEEQEAMER